MQQTGVDYVVKQKYTEKWNWKYLWIVLGFQLFVVWELDVCVVTTYRRRPFTVVCDHCLGCGYVGHLQQSLAHIQSITHPVITVHPLAVSEQCDFRFDLFFSFSFPVIFSFQFRFSFHHFFRFSFSFANNQIISNLLTKTCWWSA